MPVGCLTDRGRAWASCRPFAVGSRRRQFPVMSEWTCGETCVCGPAALRRALLIARPPTPNHTTARSPEMATDEAVVQRCETLRRRVLDKNPLHLSVEAVTCLGTPTLSSPLRNHDILSPCHVRRLWLPRLPGRERAKRRERLEGCSSEEKATLGSRTASPQDPRFRAIWTREGCCRCVVKQSECGRRTQKNVRRYHDANGRGWEMLRLDAENRRLAPPLSPTISRPP